MTKHCDSITKKSVADADIAQLVARLDEVERTQARLQAERDQHRTLYHQMLERCRKLEMGLRNQPAERLPDGEQLSREADDVRQRLAAVRTARSRCSADLRGRYADVQNAVR